MTQDNPSGQQHNPGIQVDTHVTEEQIAQGVAVGIDEGRVRAAAAVIELTPQIPATLVSILGLPAGDSQFRVAREYDTQDAQESGIVDATRFVLYTVLGRIEFTVPKSAVLAALSVEVPYVAPPEAPQQS